MGAGAGKGRAPSQRQRRVGETLRHALAGLLARRELRDPALAERSITVSEVRVSPDMRSATVYVSPLGGGDVDEVVAGLTRAAPHLGARLAALVKLKTMPRLHFLADRSFDDALCMETMLRATGAGHGPEGAAPAGDDDR